SRGVPPPGPGGCARCVCGAVISLFGARPRSTRWDAQHMTAISLGMPSVPLKLADRRKSRKIQVGSVAVGGDAPVSVQSMATTVTAAVRVNPRNIRQFDDKFREIATAASAAGAPIRIGVNAGSLDRQLLEKYSKATPEALVESALWECSLFEEHGFQDIKISVKHND